MNLRRHWCLQARQEVEQLQEQRRLEASSRMRESSALMEEATTSMAAGQSGLPRPGSATHRLEQELEANPGQLRPVHARLQMLRRQCEVLHQHLAREAAARHVQPQRQQMLDRHSELLQLARQALQIVQRFLQSASESTLSTSYRQAFFPEKHRHFNVASTARVLLSLT